MTEKKRWMEKRRSAKDDRFCKVKFGEEAGASLLLNEHRLKSVPTSTASSTTDTV
jgi:hypothetical protein